MTLFSHQDKRRIREEIEKKRRNSEEEKLKLQYLKVCIVMNNNYNICVLFYYIYMITLLQQIVFAFCDCILLIYNTVM